MKKYIHLNCLLFGFFFCSAGFAQYASDKFAVVPALNGPVAFPLGTVQLTDDLFLDAKKKIHRYLLVWDADSLLYWHRKAAGLQPRSTGHYGGWESGGSNILGHYLTAISLMYATTSDSSLSNRINYIVDELALCQQAAKTGAVFNGPGYDKAFDKMRNGQFSYRLVGPEFPLVNDGNYFYGIHKNIAGLRDAYLLGGNQKAKDVLAKYVDWISGLADAIPEAQFQEVLYVEHGGMAEVIADLYAITGNEKYARLAKKFVQQKLAAPLAAGQDMLYPQHANSRIPQFVGYERLHELLGDQAALEGKATLNFWDIVTKNHTLVNGGNSEYERFGPSGQISQRIGLSSSETCNTYNMLKLSHQLYERTGNTKYLDYYEGALYNHILASLDADGMFCYYVSTKPGWFKTFSTPFDANWCCVGSGMENPGKYEQDIYAHDAASVYVNLFISSKLDWKERGFALQQQTRFPQSDTIRLQVLESDGTTGLKIRSPKWLAGPAQVWVNEKVEKTSTQAGYISIDRKLRKGDAIIVVLPMTLRIEETPDNPTIGAILYGPLLLAGDLGNAVPAETLRTGDMWGFRNKPELKNIPVLVADKSRPETWITKAKPGALAFSMKASDGRVIPLRPFYSIYNQRYSVYWDLFSPAQWQAYKKYQTTYLRDQVTPDDSTAEAAHSLQQTKTFTQTIYFKTSRSLQDSGAFSYTMKAATAEPLFLVVKYWGGGWGPDPAGIVEVYVEDAKIATHDLGNKQHETTFYDQHYALPLSLTKDKKTIKVGFRAKSGKTESGIFSCKLVTAAGLPFKDLLKDQ